MWRPIVRRASSRTVIRSARPATEVWFGSADRPTPALFDVDGDAELVGGQWQDNERLPRSQRLVDGVVAAVADDAGGAGNELDLGEVRAQQPGPRQRSEHVGVGASGGHRDACRLPEARAAATGGHVVTGERNVPSETYTNGPPSATQRAMSGWSAEAGRTHPPRNRCGSGRPPRPASRSPAGLL